MSEGLENRRSRLIAKLYEKHVLPEYRNHAGRLCRYLERNGWDHLIPRMNDENLHSLAYEDFYKKYIRYSESELSQALKDGKTPDNDEYTIESLFFIILRSRFIDAIRKKSAIEKNEQSWPTGDDGEELDLPEDYTETLKRDKVYELSACRNEFVQFLNFYVTVVDTTKVICISGQARDQETLDWAILVIEVEGEHDETGTKEDRVATLLKLKLDTDKDRKSFRNHYQYRRNNLRMLTRDYKAWSVYTQIYRRFADEIRDNKPLISWFKLVECDKLSERPAQSKLRQVLLNANIRNIGSEEYGNLKLSYRERKEKYINSLSDKLVRLREDLGKDALDDPFAYVHAMAYFSLKYTWPDFLQD